MNGSDDGKSPREIRSPYAPPKTPPQSDDRISDDPSVFNEPWMKANTQRFEANAEPLEGAHLLAGDVDPENSVWDEPGLSRELSGDPPKDAVTWLSYFQKQAAQTTWSTSWGVTMAVALASGICAIFGAIFLQLGTQNQFLQIVVAAPISEEIMKVALAIWICEKRPWLFRSRKQILICGAASALVFAAIENVMYLSLGATPGLALWRWTVCVLLHVTCSIIASVGVVKVWTEFQRQQRMPQLSDGAPWFIAAMLLHGTYNFTVTIMEVAGLHF